MPRIMRFLLSSLAIGAGLFVTSNSAATAQDTGTVVFENRHAGSLTDAQWQSLYGPKGPRPGVYKLKPLHSGKCVVVDNRVGLTEIDYLAQLECAKVRESMSDFFVIPHPAGGFTVRTRAYVRRDRRVAGPGQIVYCATVARGVVFGPARIDLHPCELPVGAGDWLYAGVDDQRFNIVPVGPSNYEIRPIANPDNCWALRNGSRDSLTDLLRWSCTGGSDQHFNFQWSSPIAATDEVSTLQTTGWHLTPDGHRRLVKANGVELQGPSSSYFETIADDGDYCMKRCAELTECKGWTWSAAGFGGQTKPMCHWKTSLGTPINHGPSALGKVMSGIIRP